MMKSSNNGSPNDDDDTGVSHGRGSEKVVRLGVGGLRLTELDSLTDNNADMRYVPTDATTRPGDPRGLYVSTQGGLILRFDTVSDRFDKTPFRDLTDEVDAMRQAAGRYKQRPMAHVPYPDGFVTKIGLSDERGLLGLVFDPEPPHDLFVHLSMATDCEKYDHYATVLCWPMSATGEDTIITTKPIEILRVGEREFNHNGGSLVFGPHDHMLYIGMGDEGGENDEHGLKLPSGSHFGNGQDPTRLHGKILRIKPADSGSADGGAYTIPHDNPLVEWHIDDWPQDVSKYFVGAEIRNEVWAMGLRNPWKFSFWPSVAVNAHGGRPGMLRLAIADVGQNLVEEVNVVTIPERQSVTTKFISSTKPPILNFGWRVMEGDRVFDRTLQRLLTASQYETYNFLQPPVLTYGHGDGVAVIGGYPLNAGSRERAAVAESIIQVPGGKIPGDIYVFGDYHGRVFVGWSDAYCNNGKWQMRELFRLPETPHSNSTGSHPSTRNLNSFARDARGRLYVLWTDSFHVNPSGPGKHSGISRIEYTNSISSSSSSSGSIISSNANPGSWIGSRDTKAAVEGLLSPSDMHKIALEALTAANEMKDTFRRNPRTGDVVSPVMQVVVLSKPAGVDGVAPKFWPPVAHWPSHYMGSTNIGGINERPGDAWSGSADIARAKAYTALAFSSDENAMTSRGIGELSQPGKALYGIENSNLGTSGPPDSGIMRRGAGIITFPGGLPLYDPLQMKLVGAIGVSGSTPDTDEAVAMAGAVGWAPSAFIRTDIVTNNSIHYTKPFLTDEELRSMTMRLAHLRRSAQAYSRAVSGFVSSVAGDNPISSQRRWQSLVERGSLALAKNCVGSAVRNTLETRQCRAAETLNQHALARAGLGLVSPTAETVTDRASRESAYKLFHAMGSAITEELGQKWAYYHTVVTDAASQGTVSAADMVTAIMHVAMTTEDS